MSRKRPFGCLADFVMWYSAICDSVYNVFPTIKNEPMI